MKECKNTIQKCGRELLTRWCVYTWHWCCEVRRSWIATELFCTWFIFMDMKPGHVAETCKLGVQVASKQEGWRTPATIHLLITNSRLYFMILDGSSCHGNLVHTRTDTMYGCWNHACRKWCIAPQTAVQSPAQSPTPILKPPYCATRTEYWNASPMKGFKNGKDVTTHTKIDLDRSRNQWNVINHPGHRLLTKNETVRQNSFMKDIYT